MIQIQIFCDGCKSNLSVVISARKAQSVHAAVVGLLWELHDPQCKEDPDGEGRESEEIPDREEARPDESGSGSPRGRVEGGSAPGTPWERVGRA